MLKSIDCKDEEFLSAIKRLKENVLLLPHDVSDDEKIPYLNSRVDTPIVFSTKDIFSNTDQIATIGLCFGKNIKEKDLKTKKLVLKERSFYKKIKITY